MCTASSTTPIALQYFFVESKGDKALLVAPIPIYHCSCIIVVGLLEPLTAWKVSKYGVISSPNTGKYGPEITSHLDTFHAVS